MSQLGEALIPIRAILDKLDQDLAEARGKVDKSVGKLSGIELGISTAVADKSIELLQNGIRLATDTLADGVSMAADLEAQLDTIGAISGATEAEVAGLKKTVSELGIDPNLKVSAFEAAQAVEELAAGGVALEDIMNGAARGTVALANASGADFALAATVAADSMSLFKIEAKDLEQVVDGVAAVAVQSKFDVNDYALALAQAGGVAATSGVEFDDFNTTIAGIAPLFASGSDAGTSLKVMLQRLIADTGPSKAAMTELGLITEEAGNRFFDAEGNLKSMSEVAGLMQEAFAGLSEEQRNAALQTIFGTDAMRAAVGLMELGADGFTEMQQQMAQTSGLDAAAERMGNLKGQTEILNGVVESLQIQYGERLIPKLTEMAEKATEFASTQGPALVDSLADLTLGAIDFGERASPALERGLGTITGLGDSTNKLVESAMELGKALGLVGEKADEVDAVLLILNGVVDAAMAPYEGLRIIVDQLGLTFKTWGTIVQNVTGWFDDLGNSLSGLDDNLPSWLQPGSPPPLAFALADISQELERMPDFNQVFSASDLGGNNTSIVNIDGISATSVGGGDPADEAIRLTLEMLRARLKRKR